MGPNQTSASRSAITTKPTTTTTSTEPPLQSEEDSEQEVVDWQSAPIHGKNSVEGKRVPQQTPAAASDSKTTKPSTAALKAEPLAATAAVVSIDSNTDSVVEATVVSESNDTKEQAPTPAPATAT